MGNIGGIRQETRDTASANKIEVFRAGYERRLAEAKQRQQALEAQLAAVKPLVRALNAAGLSPEAVERISADPDLAKRVAELANGAS